jgi:hypothetical protein
MFGTIIIDSVTSPSVKTCLYCGLEKSNDAFSDEHIWPDALGGDHLPLLWRTDEVCVNCNSMSGVFVDGSFTKSWVGAAERATGAGEYLSPNQPSAGVLLLDYIGPLPDVPTRQGEIAEYWCGPCGANIIHIRPDDSDEHWKSYAGGDPRAALVQPLGEVGKIVTAFLPGVFAQFQLLVSHHPLGARMQMNFIWVSTVLQRPPENRIGAQVDKFCRATQAGPQSSLAHASIIGFLPPICPRFM